MNTRIKSIICILILTVLLSTCTVNPGTPTETGIPDSATATRAPLTDTVLTSTATEREPSSTPSSTATMIPATATSTSTPQPPTPTPGPTIAPDLVEDFLIDLYQTNAGCQLPCWWGFIPQVSMWQDVKYFYQSFGGSFVRDDYSYTNMQMEIYSTDYTFDGSGVEMWGAYALDGNKIDSIFMGGTTVRNEQEIVGDAFYRSILLNFQLPAILSTYGIPDEVLVRTFPGAPEGGDIPYYIILDYNQTGIYIKYWGNVVQTNSLFYLCPQRVNIRMLLWSPDKSNPVAVERLREIVVSKVGVVEYKSIQEAFNMSLQEFYDTFKTPGNQNCIPTDPDDWDMW